MTDTRETTRRHLRKLINGVLNGELRDELVFMALEASKHLKATGTYQRKFDNEPERVLHRHLNLYRNKFKAAVKQVEKDRWAAKIDEQNAKIIAFNVAHGRIANTMDLDLDGL